MFLVNVHEFVINLKDKSCIGKKGIIGYFTATVELELKMVPRGFPLIFISTTSMISFAFGSNDWALIVCGRKFCFLLFQLIDI